MARRAETARRGTESEMLTESAPNLAAVLPSQGVDADRDTQPEDHVDDGNCRALMHRFMRAFL
jgi:hypothetical protein